MKSKDTITAEQHYLLKEADKKKIDQANNTAFSLFNTAQNNEDIGVRKLAARYLYFLCRDMTEAMRDLHEIEPILFEGLAATNESAPWSIREGDNQKTAIEWLKTVGMANELPPKVREIKTKKDFVDKRALATAFRKKTTEAFALVLNEWKYLPCVSPNGKKTHLTTWPGPNNNIDDARHPIPQGTAFETIVNALGWKEAARFLPYPKKDKGSPEFKAWLTVVKRAFKEFPIRDKLLEGADEILKKSKGKRTKFHYESDQIINALSAAIQMRKSFSK